MALDVDLRVHVQQAFTRRVQLRAPHVLGTVDDLSLEVAVLDGVEVHQPDRAHARGGQVERGRRAEAAGADDQHPRLLELLLALEPDLRHDDVPGVAADLVCCEFHVFHSGRRADAARDRGNDSDLVAGLDAALRAIFKVADILVI